MNHDASPIVELKSLTKLYDADNGTAVKAIDHLSLTVPSGCIFGLLGADRAGKTTLVKLIAGLITPTSGKICLAGHRLTCAHPATVERVGLVLDGLQNINPKLSIWANFNRIARVKGWSPGELYQRAIRILAGLLPVESLECVVEQLPYPEQRLVAFACTLIADPSLVIADEPLAGLEPETAQTAKAWLAKLVYQHGKTVVLATQDPDLVEELCDEVAIINQGRLVMQQPVAHLLHSLQAALYQIKIKGHLARHWSEWFDNLSISYTDTGETILSGFIADQAALYGVLIKVRDLALPLLSVTQTEPNLAQVMQSLTSTEWVHEVS
jgi:ABC-2 type transport system ATP-binding protein